VPTAEIDDDNAAARRTMRGNGALIPAPEAHFMPGQREISRRRERAVAPTQDGDAHF
jgi:hypothetical protein